MPRVAIHRTPSIAFIKSVKIGPSIPKMFLDLLLLAKAVQLLARGRYDLLHTHEEASFFGVLLARLFKVPHLYDMHSSPTEQLSNFRFTRLRSLVRLFDLIERKVIGSSDAVITICPALEDRVKAIDSAVPQVMIENVAAKHGKEPVSDETVRTLRDTLPSLEDKKVVLYAGTFETYQGIDLLIDSARIVARRRPDVAFLLVGGRPDQIAGYEARVRELGLSDRFFFPGTRPPEEIPAFIDISDVLVSPRTDGTNTPLKIYSYLRSGKPIVATDLPTHTQVLSPEVAVLVEPAPESFADGILSVLEDAALVERLKSNSRRLFETAYSFETYVEKTDQALRMAVR